MNSHSYNSFSSHFSHFFFSPPSPFFLSTISFLSFSFTILLLSSLYFLLCLRKSLPLHLLLSFSICTFSALNYRRKFKENEGRKTRTGPSRSGIAILLSLSLSPTFFSLCPVPVSPIQCIGIFLSSPSHFSRPSHQDTCYFPLSLSPFLSLSFLLFFLSLPFSLSLEKQCKLTPGKEERTLPELFVLCHPPSILRTHSSLLTLSLFILLYPSHSFLPRFRPFFAETRIRCRF